MNGRYFIGYINNGYGQSVAYSDDNGATWSMSVTANGSLFNILDKNHLWVDNSPTSPFNGYLYNGWMESNNIQVSRSITNGTSWEPKINISSATSAGSHNQGINFKTGPDGEAYAAWSVYDSWPGDEKAIGFSKSLDGGITWEEMKVSDVSWVPSPIPGMATGYFGDYLGIDMYNSKAYPCWNDNRLGYSMTYVSPIDLHIPASLVVYQDDFINDSDFGNGNGKMDFGETILLGLEMVNDGGLEAEDINVTLSTESPYITFEDSTEFFGNFDVGESITIMDAFKFDVSSYIPDGYIVNFQVTAVNSLDSATISFFGIEAHAPAVTILGMSIDDAAGNNNGKLDPGESAIINFLTKNTGEYDALDILRTLESSNPFVYVEDDLFDIGTLAAGESVYAPFPVLVSDDCPYGSATVFHNEADWEFGMDEVYKTAMKGLFANYL
ncbi:MAG: hypothetical protein HQ542_12705 [Bacteroidia bacterium]|nr:hypothetical protein [Bacteroidia bacterium]